MTDDRIALAESFLQEAVYQSRARQAAGVGLSGSTLDSAPAPGGCGLGDGASVDLELTPRGEELFRELWPRTVAPTELARIESVLHDWVESQDALDRKRNHFLRDFRQANGFDRRAYSKERAQAFEDGLARVNAEVNLKLRRAAEELLSL